MAGVGISLIRSLAAFLSVAFIFLPIRAAQAEVSTSTKPSYEQETLRQSCRELMQRLSHFKTLADKNFLRAVPGPYTPFDFDYSWHWSKVQKKENSPIYPVWAANEANRVYSQMREGRSDVEILVNLARRRRILEAVISDEVGQLAENRESQVGQFRTSPKEVRLMVATGSIFTMGEQWSSWMRDEDFVGDESFAFIRDTHRSLMGEPIDSGTFWRQQYVFNQSPVRVYKVNLPFDVVDPLMSDALARLDAARSSSLSDTEKFSLLVPATRAFFRSMPFTKGSASIGRSFWSGAFAATLDRKFPVRADTDVRALLPSASRYGEEFLPMQERPLKEKLVGSPFQ